MRIVSSFTFACAVAFLGCDTGSDGTSFGDNSGNSTIIVSCENINVACPVNTTEEVVFVPEEEKAGLDCSTALEFCNVTEGSVSIPDGQVTVEINTDKALMTAVAAHKGCEPLITIDRYEGGAPVETLRSIFPSDDAECV